MTQIPINLQRDELTDRLEKSGIELISQGKVRNAFRLTDTELLSVTSDRISVFDFVLKGILKKLKRFSN